MFDRYIKNYVQDADVIVANGGRNARIVDILAGYVQDELRSAALRPAPEENMETF